VADGDAVGLGQFLLVERGVHVFLAAAVGHVTSSAPSSLACMAASIAVMPPPMTTTLRPISGVKDLRPGADADEIDCVENASRIFAVDAERVDAGQPHSKETGVVIRGQLLERDVAAERLAVFDGDAADFKMKSTSSWAKSLVVL
jgi:hypothetical protein